MSFKYPAAIQLLQYHSDDSGNLATTLHNLAVSVAE